MQGTQAELAEEGRRMGCRMLVEGPGHVPLEDISEICSDRLLES